MTDQPYYQMARKLLTLPADPVRVCSISFVSQ
jgi:hypothetical protein